MSNDLWRLDAVDVAKGIREGDFSSREVVRSCLDRLDAVNPRLNAVTEVRPDDALAAADAADGAMAAGEALGLLHGVPVTIKGNVDLAGWATVNGCAAWKDNVAPASSPCVQNWLDAGAIVLGRTNTPEFSVRWETNNEVFGPTANPWDATRTPGGSSGGASASIAAGITPLASGTDLGGSLRQPAQACGVASIRPGRGRVPDFNYTGPPEPGIGFQLMNVNGAIGRRIEDLRMALAAMAGGSWRDPGWAPVPLELAAPVERKVALVLDPDAGGISSQVRTGVEAAGRILASAGYDVVESEPPRIADAVEVWKAVCFHELLNHLEPAARSFCGAGMTRTFACYRAVEPDASAEKAYEALALRCAVLREWLGFFEEYPLIVAPVGTEPPLGRDEDIASPEQTREAVHSFRMVVAINALSLPAATVPVGVEDGLPQVVQIIGPPFSELRCLAAAEAIEQTVGALTPIDPR